MPLFYFLFRYSYKPVIYTGVINQFSLQIVYKFAIQQGNRENLCFHVVEILSHSVSSSALHLSHCLLSVCKVTSLCRVCHSGQPLAATDFQHFCCRQHALCCTKIWGCSELNLHTYSTLISNRKVELPI